jgi:hypothetical protein
MNNSAQQTLLELIKNIAKNVGLDENKTVVEIQKTDNPNVKKLILESGSWSAGEPWFVVDEDKKLHTMISMESINKIIDNFKVSQEENFNLKLEKSIWQNIPIDFQDVWAIAMDEIKRMAKNENKEAKVISVDLEHLVYRIKLEHPNLFIDLQDLHVVPRQED